MLGTALRGQLKENVHFGISFCINGKKKRLDCAPALQRSCMICRLHSFRLRSFFVLHPVLTSAPSSVKAQPVWMTCFPSSPILVPVFKKSNFHVSEQMLSLLAEPSRHLKLTGGWGLLTGKIRSFLTWILHQLVPAPPLRKLNVSNGIWASMSC